MQPRPDPGDRAASRALREVFCDVATYAADPAGSAAGRLSAGAGDEARITAGQTLAHRHDRDGATAAHVPSYRSL